MMKTAVTPCENAHGSRQLPCLKMRTEVKGVTDSIWPPISPFTHSQPSRGPDTAGRSFPKQLSVAVLDVYPGHLYPHPS